jgi:hypothetical protein
MKSGHDTTTIPSAPAPAWDANVSDDSIPLDVLSLDDTTLKKAEADADLQRR